MRPAVTAVRPHPPCGHKRLMECPLSPDDWQQVLDAHLAFLHQCRVIAARAHARQTLDAFVSKPDDPAALHSEWKDEQ